MDEEKYTWKDLIFNPTTDESKSAIGKEVYYSDTPSNCIDYANENNKEFLGVLDRTEKSNNPFHIKESINWACIIVKKKTSYEECAKQWIEENNLKEGDYVKVLRKAKDFESGWDATWNDLMNKSVCKILKITEVRFCNGHIILEDGYRYPYFILEKSEPPKPKYVPFESKEEFVRRYTEVKKGADFDTFEDNLFQCGMWLKDKEIDSFLMVTEIWDDGVIVTDRKMKTTKVVDDEYLTINEPTTWEQLLRGYTFIDGSQCGKLAEESNA